MFSVEKMWTTSEHSFETALFCERAEGLMNLDVIGMGDKPDKILLRELILVYFLGQVDIWKRKCQTAGLCNGG
jgi:hypothetical protein